MFHKLTKKIKKKHIKCLYVCINIIILLYFFSNMLAYNKRYINIIYENINVTKLINSNTYLNKDFCTFIQKNLNKRKQPFDFEHELFFFVTLISCKIPFSFIRFGDGEELIMSGKNVKAETDQWYWEPKLNKFREQLIESSNICKNDNNFIGIPCKNWIQISKSILSFSNCSSSKYMSYSTIFINKNYDLFKNWIFNFIYSQNRWKIILISNSNINKNITWAYKFFPVPDHLIENWDKISIYLLPKISFEAKKNKRIFFVSAGPAANIIISNLSKINNKNIYIDFGSSIEIITKGFSTRPYSDKNSVFSLQSCETFVLKNKLLVYS